MLIVGQPAKRSYFDDLLPADHEESDFSSLELAPPSRPKPLKRETRPIFDLIIDILDTVHSSAKADVKRAKQKESRYT